MKHRCNCVRIAAHQLREQGMSKAAIARYLDITRVYVWMVLSQPPPEKPAPALRLLLKRKKKVAP